VRCEKLKTAGISLGRGSSTASVALDSGVLGRRWVKDVAPGRMRRSLTSLEMHRTSPSVLDGAGDAPSNAPIMTMPAHYRPPTILTTRTSTGAPGIEPAFSAWKALR
jgi:hypothetical protein